MVNSIVNYFIETVKKSPDRVAVEDKNSSITFAELNEKAQKLAYLISKALNGRTKMPIGVYVSKSKESIVAFLAVLFSGNFYTPLDVTMPESRLEKIIGTLQPALLIVDKAISEEKSLYGFNSIHISEIDNCNKKISLEVSEQTIDTDIMYVMFTSGSTGTPKGVIVPHRAVIDYIDWVEMTFHFDETTILGNQAPFYFDNSVLDIYSMVKNGSKMVIIPQETFLSGSRLCNYINEKKINTIFWVPSAMAIVANSGAFEKIEMSGLKNILFAGEVMQTKYLNIWRNYIPNAVYANLYGPTEIAVDCTYYIVDREFSDDESLPIGKKCRNTDVYVLSDEDKLVKTDEIGELCVRGTSLAFGYYGNPEKTKEVFVQNPLNDKYRELIYRTGDLVKYNSLDEIIYVGRKDSQIKHMGYRIELGEIENAVAAYKEIKTSCALYDDVNKKIIIFVTPSTVNKKELFGALKKQLPNYMLPGVINAIDELPLNQNGKIDRLALKNELIENH